VGQAGPANLGTGQMKGTHNSGQIRSESPRITDTDPGGSPPRTAGNDTHRSVDTCIAFSVVRIGPHAGMIATRPSGFVRPGAGSRSPGSLPRWLPGTASLSGIIASGPRSLGTLADCIIALSPLSAVWRGITGAAQSTDQYTGRGFYGRDEHRRARR
jgi:hypothetical protein